jgi:penicillin-binding protein 2
MNRKPSQRPIKHQADEQRLFVRRAVTGMMIIVACLLALLLRYFYLQVVMHDEFTTRSENNRVQVRPMPPNRGLIYDRRGRLVAENVPAYRLEVIPEKVRDLEQTLAELAQLIEISEEDLRRFHQSRSRYRDFQGVPLRFNLAEKEVAVFSVNRHRFDGVDVVPYLSRHYPYGELLTHVLGYVGRLDARDLRSVDENNYRGTTQIGKAGIERFYETVLHGTTGVEWVETNSRGRALTTLQQEDPIAGSDLVLSLDVSVQKAAHDALGDGAGAVVAIDPRDGSVIALVSKPSFDGNAFVNGIDSRSYQEILNAPNRPLFNRAINGGYEPGSTLKPFIGLAGLELDVTDRDRRVFSNGAFQIEEGGRPYRDWKKGGHGWVDIEGALEESVNTYFYDLALKLGIDRIHEYLGQFGFGQPTGIDLPGEGSGLLPSRDWKRGRFNEPWYPGETVISGIGQGFNVVTPVQLAAALSALVHGGDLRRPRLLYAVKPPGGETAQRAEAPVVRDVPVVDEADWAAVLEGMRRVVNGVRGTARSVALDAPYEIAGKTGTAQVFGLAAGEEYEEAEVAEHLRHHALFIAFAPFEEPRIAVAVVVDHGGAGSTRAAPVARAVLDAWLQQEWTP